AEAAGDAGAFRVGAPVGLLLAGRFELGAQPALDVEGADGIDLAELPGADQGIARVVVGYAEDDARLGDDLGQLLGLSEIEGERLVAHDVEAGLRERL